MTFPMKVTKEAAFADWSRFHCGGMDCFEKEIILKATHPTLQTMWRENDTCAFIRYVSQDLTMGIASAKYLWHYIKSLVA